MIKGAVFDMDGLMFDTERLVYDNWQRMMDEIGLPYDIEVFKQTVGRRKKEVELFYRATYGNDFPYWELAGKGRAMYVRRVKQEGIPVKPGLYEILERLKERGVRIALATSTSRHTAELNLRLARVLDYFDALICGEEVTNGKPHPEVFLTAAQKLGLAPGDCAALEDSINGIKSAYAAGMITVMVPDLLPPTDEINPMITHLCGDLSEAAALLCRLEAFMFRPLTPADKALYYHYVDLFYHSDAVEAPVPRKNYDATFAELMRSQDYLKCYIFEDNGQPCGFALLSKTFSQEAGGVSVTIEEIYIDEAHRSKGLATEFFTYLKGQKEIARLRIEVEDDNEGARRLYERMGFHLLPYLQMIMNPDHI